MEVARVVMAAVVAKKMAMVAAVQVVLEMEDLCPLCKGGCRTWRAGHTLLTRTLVAQVGTSKEGP